MVRLLMTLLLVALATGCTTPAERVRDARLAFFAGDLERTIAMLEQADRGRASDRDCLLLDRAMVAMTLGRSREAENLLREVRDQFDHLEQQHLGEEALALLSDETRRAYSGEDYEKVLIRAFLAVANLMHGGEDAAAYCLQIEEKQRVIVAGGRQGAAENPKLAYKHVALGAYLHGVLQEATHANYDGAERAYGAVASWEPGFLPARFDLARARAGVHSSRGHGVVYVVALVGRGPHKAEATAPVTTEALLIADRLLSVMGEHTLPPTIAPVKISRIVAQPNAIDGVLVSVNDQPVGATQTVTDVTGLAVQQHEATLQHQIARAVVRRVLKKAAVYGAKDVLDINNPWTNLALDAAGVIWEATESADTRGWGLLPDKIQVLRVELPAGVQRLALRPARQGRPLGPSQASFVSVEDGRNTYVLAYFVEGRLVGQIHQSRAAESFE